MLDIYRKGRQKTKVKIVVQKQQLTHPNKA
jgi:hypothetical protein